MCPILLLLYCVVQCPRYIAPTLDRPLDRSLTPLTHASDESTQVLKVGVIGVGRIGRVHIESIQAIKDATVVMVRPRILPRPTPPQALPRLAHLINKPPLCETTQIRWRTSGRRARGR